MLYKCILDLEIRNENFEEVRKIYEKLSRLTCHAKVYISYALFEYQLENYEKMRQIVSKAEQKLKKDKNKQEERNLLIEKWLKCEEKINDEKELEKVKKKIPKKIKKQRKIEIYDT